MSLKDNVIQTSRAAIGRVLNNRALNGFINKVELLTLDGDVYNYVMSKFSSRLGKIGENDFNRIGLESPKKVAEDYRRTHGPLDETMPSLLERNDSYNYMVISALAHNFNYQKGMYYYANESGSKFVALKATLNGDRYPDKWLLKDIYLYYMMEKENNAVQQDSMNLSHMPNSQLFTHYKMEIDIDTHVFVRNNPRDDYSYSGVYRVIRVDTDKHAFYLLNSCLINEKRVENTDVLFEDLEDNQDGKYVEATVSKRVGQTIFRERLFDMYGDQCCFCNIRGRELLIASHIKPFRDCSKAESLDPNNGLLLCPLHDKLFDIGLITVNADGMIQLSEKIGINYDLINSLTKDRVTLGKKTLRYLGIHERLFDKGFEDK